MNVLLVSENLVLGGAQTMSVSLANALVSMGMNNVYFTSAPGSIQKKLDSRVYYFELPKFNLRNIRPSVRSLEKIICKVGPDIVHSHGATISVLAGMACCRTRPKAVRILTRHSRTFKRMPPTMAARLLNRYCDHIIAISNSLCQEMGQAGIRKDRISVIPNFVRCDDFDRELAGLKKSEARNLLGLPEKGLLAIVVSRLIAGKGLEKFIDIIKRCQPLVPGGLVGVMVGDGVLSENLKRKAEKSLGNGKIFFSGYSNHVIRYLIAGDVFISIRA